MAFAAGTRLGHFEIVEPLGSGGMGDVYKARDTRLDRTVAIKLLRPDVQSDAAARERLEREARAVSALNHPNICTLYDISRFEDTDFLVMEFVDGETLATRLARGPVPLAQALRCATELASALDRAHRAGIVHRDIKPGNVMITRAGTKLLDFGLAKPSTLPAIGNTQATVSRDALTHSGFIVGTVQYMAPEQIEGRTVDARTDIFAFGAVLYEMVTGRKAFDGGSVASILAAIAEKQPPPVSSVQPVVPAALDRVIATCLAKDPEDRWQHARDLMRELEWISNGGESSSTTIAPVPRSKRASPMLVAAGVAVGAIAALLVAPQLWSGSAVPINPDVRFSIYPEVGSQFVNAPASVVTPQFALSPDGSHLVFVASLRGRPMLWLRPLNALTSRVLPGTEDPMYPFWSPDSASVAFFSQGKIKTISIAGGEPIVRGDASRDPRGGTWATDGTILASTMGYAGVVNVAVSGTVEPSLAVDRANGEANHRWPTMLADGRHYVYMVRSVNEARRGVTLAARGDAAGTRLVDSDFSAAVTGDHLLFVRGRTLMAQPLDLANRRLTGEAVALVDNVGASSTGYSAFNVSNAGPIAYASAWPVDGELVWLDRSGRQVGAPVAPTGDYIGFSLSPDGSRVVVSRVDPQTATPDLWALDLTRPLQQRLTFDRMTDANAFWSPDGSEILFRSNRTGMNRAYRRGVYDTSPETLLEWRVGDDVMGNMVLTDRSRDGRHVLLTYTGGAGSFGVWRYSEGEEPPLQKVVDSPFDEFQATLSPDQRWVAYVSNDAGHPDVYVLSFPDLARRYQISSEGGSEPQWRPDGKELFFLSARSELMSVDVSTAPDFKAGVPKPLFQVRTPVMANPYRQQYAVSADGQRFLVNRASADVGPPAIHIVLDWRKLLPSAR